MAVGARHKCSVGEVETLHNVEVRLLIRELVEAVSKVRVEAHFVSIIIIYIFSYANKIRYRPTIFSFEVEWKTDSVHTRLLLVIIPRQSKNIRYVTVSQSLSILGAFIILITVICHV